MGAGIKNEPQPLTMTAVLRNFAVGDNDPCFYYITRAGEIQGESEEMQMEEMVQQAGNDLTLLNGLAREARMYSEAAALNLFQLGRVLIEAKRLVRHGEWTDWVRGNAHMSETQAQYLMRSFERFGQTPEMARLEKSKIFKMLSLPAGTEQAFMEENDVLNMSAREVEQAVRKVREEAEAQIQAERRKRIAAEARADELAERPAEIPQDIAEQMKAKEAEIARYKGECMRISEQARDIMAEKNAIARDLKETEAMLKDQQQEYDHLQRELLNARSMAAKGDAERTVDDRLTAAEFTRAVGQFIGIVSRVPHMGRAFSAMGYDERDDFSTALKVVEEWAESARKAMNTIEASMGGMIIHAE